MRCLASKRAHTPRVPGGSRPDDRREGIVKTLQKATLALGGDTVVFAFGGLSLVDARTGQVLSSTDAVRGEGYALRTLDGATKPAAAPVQSTLPRPFDFTQPAPVVASRRSED
jgi:hypothetical protein